MVYDRRWAREGLKPLAGRAPYVIRLSIFVVRCTSFSEHTLLQRSETACEIFASNLSKMDVGDK